MLCKTHLNDLLLAILCTLLLTGSAGCNSKEGPTEEENKKAKEQQTAMLAFIKKCGRFDSPAKDQSIGWVLDVTGCEITDEQIGGLRSLTFLDRIILENSTISDQQLRSLADLINLTSIDLTGTDITAVGLSYFNELPNIKWMDLSRTQISDAALYEVIKFKKLSFLGLNRTLITNDGVEILSELKQLEAIWLNHNALSHRGLVHLEKMPQLRELTLQSMNIEAKNYRIYQHTSEAYYARSLWM